MVDINKEFCRKRNEVLVQHKDEACEDGRTLIGPLASELGDAVPGVASSLFVDHAMSGGCDLCRFLLRKANGVAFDKK